MHREGPTPTPTRARARSVERLTGGGTSSSTAETVRARGASDRASVGDWTSVGPVSGRRRGRGGKASERARARGHQSRECRFSFPDSESER